MRFRDREIEVLRGDQKTVLKKVDEFAEMDKHHPFITESIKKYNLTGDRKSLEKIFNAIFKLIIFFPDPEDVQYVRTVNRSLKDRRGNCVDYSVIFSAFLRALNVPHVMRIVEYPNQSTPGISHIYIQTLDGITLDAVIGQDQHGREANKLYRSGKFDVEILPIKKKIDRVWK